MAALGTAMQILFHRFAPDDLAAGVALLPQALGTDALFIIVGVNRGLLARKPGHKISLYSSMRDAPNAPDTDANQACDAVTFEKIFRFAPRKTRPPAISSIVAHSDAGEVGPVLAGRLLTPANKSSKTTAEPAAVLR